MTKRYGDVAAVDNLDLSVPEGTLYGFLGPNGAGKTTTIRMALGLIFPTGGEIDVLGHPVFGSRGGSRETLRHAGALVEEPAFWKYLSGRRNLRYLAMAAGPAEDRDARLARVDEVLRLVDLEAAADKKVKAFSQGMRQRLGIAAALLGRAEVLMLDEPTNGLDPQGMREVRLLLRRLADGGTTVFVSSHLLWEVEAMCDRVGVLARGRLVADGPPSELRRVGDHVRVEVDDPALAVDTIQALPGVQVVEQEGGRLRIRLDAGASGTTPAELNQALVGAGVAVSALVPERASLEDVFLSLVEGAEAPR